ncbi:MAG: pseudouridine-5-phosphate glycosidase [Leptothrix sp. (in: Bacteria)]|nr:pseudouridine-5-phosphate glycosidase [Leptothrix sp. (in: b-proteobacteria)]
MNELLDIHPEVAAALAAGRPVVALESTIISHGMPWPQNVETALRVEAAVREHGAVPATVAVMGGRLQAGLTPEAIERLGRQGLAVPKASRRDLPFLLAEGVGPAMGATTVAATMIVAALAGIRVFATGGIGGVHRGAEASFDISADLQELARTSVAVVCAGAKAILDLPLTLQYLETHGVPVIGFGTDALPAFYSRSSGLKVDRRLDTPEAVARVLHAKWRAGLQGGVVVAQPIAAEHALPPERMDACIQQALQEAQQQGVAGAATTPFLLARVSELTGGDSLAANIELVLANARLAARVAAALCTLSALPR